MNDADNLKNLNEYDSYYQGGNKSLYNRRFGKKRIIYREFFLIQKNLKISINYYIKKDIFYEFKILDFGCGDGRLFEAIESVIESYSNSKLSFNITCYDVSLTGINEFKNKLLANNYVCYDHNSKYLNLQKNNINLSLMYIDNIESSIYVESQLGYNYNLILCMFGVLAHIPGYENRNNIIQMFYNIIENQGRLLISVPTARSFRDEQILYKKLRTSQDFAKIKLATEDGDLYYQVKNSEIFNFYHIFKYGELEKSVRLSNLKLLDITTYFIIHPTISSKHILISQFDHIIASIISLPIFPKSLLYKFSKYIMITATKE